MPRYPYGVRPPWESSGRPRSLEKVGTLHFGGEVKKTTGEKYIEAIEEEGDIEAVTKRFLNLMTRQAGATKEASKHYLERELRKAIEEGRL